MTRNALSWVVVFIDVASIIIILIAIYVLPHSQVARSNFYNKNKIMISDMTVHLRNMDLKGSKIYDEISEVMKHVENVMIMEDKTLEHKDQIIYDINFPVMTVFQLDSITDINELELEKLQKSNEEASEANNAKIIAINEKLIKLKKELKDSFVNDMDDTDDVFITFHSQTRANNFKSLYLDIGGVSRRFQNCCGKTDYNHL